MVIKDRVSGFLWVKPTKNQTKEAAFKAIVEWSHRFGLNHTKFVLMGGGVFTPGYIEKLKQMGGHDTYLRFSVS